MFGGEKVRDGGGGGYCDEVFKFLDGDSSGTSVELRRKRRFIGIVRVIIGGFVSVHRVWHLSSLSRMFLLGIVNHSILVFRMLSIARPRTLKND